MCVRYMHCKWLLHHSFPNDSSEVGSSASSPLRSDGPRDGDIDEQLTGELPSSILSAPFFVSKPPHSVERSPYCVCPQFNQTLDSNTRVGDEQSFSRVDTWGGIVEPFDIVGGRKRGRVRDGVFGVYNVV